MIAFGTAMVDARAYLRFAGPGIARVAEPDSAVLTFGNPGTDARGMNLVLERAARLEDLEALVLVNEFVELTDPATCATVRGTLADPEIGAAGSIGARHAPTIAWWEGEVSSAPLMHRHYDHGGGEGTAFAWADPQPAPMEVDTLEGLLLVLSPWAVRELRFDEGLHGRFGHDFDFCRQIRAAGRKLTTAQIPAIRHRSLHHVAEKDQDLWVESHIAVAEKWAEDDVDWKARARRAEASREAARTVAYTNSSLLDIRIAALEAELAAITDTPSWRLTTPLRALNAQRRARRRA